MRQLGRKRDHETVLLDPGLYPVRAIRGSEKVDAEQRGKLLEAGPVIERKTEGLLVVTCGEHLKSTASVEDKFCLSRLRTCQ